MSTIRPPTVCGLFKPGHTPHWIQVDKAVNDNEHEPSPGLFIQSRMDGNVVIQVNDQELLLWNHQPERIDEAVLAWGRAISFQPRWGLLWVPSEIGRFAFCVVKASGHHEPCPSRPPTGTPTELLKSAGGFSVRGDQLRESKLSLNVKRSRPS